MTTHDPYSVNIAFAFAFPTMASFLTVLNSVNV